jgi:DNA-binding MarR family transcriptional regulator
MANAKKRPKRRGSYDHRVSDIEPIVDHLIEGYRRLGLDPRRASIELNWRLAVTAAARQAFFADGLQSFGLTRITGQYNVLRNIYFAQDQCLSQTEIMHMLRISSANVTRLIHGLERAGLVTREVNPADKRSTVVTLTEKGEAFCESNVATIGRVMSSLGDCFTDAEISMLNELLARLHTRIEEMSIEATAQGREMYSGRADE